MAEQLTRRTTLAGAAGLTAALPVLAACGGNGTSSAGSEGGSSSAAQSSAAKPGTVVGPASDIPVGGGKVFKQLNVVVTQPESGTFKAFSATCTHQGCQVSDVAHQAIECNCHFSKYSITDGSVEGGPAPQPLPPVAITVDAGEITLA